MKRTMVLLSVLVMCLSLCACVGDTIPSPKSSVPAVAENTEMEQLYHSAISGVEYLLNQNFPTYAYQNRLAELYSKFQELGTYKDSAEYFNRFSLAEDRITDVHLVSMDAFGNEVEKKYCEYLYDEKGNIIVNWTSEYDFVVNYYDKDGRYIYHNTFENDWITDLGIEVLKGENGKVTEVHWISDAGIVEIVYKYTYEENGRSIKVEHTYSESYNGPRYFPFECIYNEEGKCIEKRLFDGTIQEVYKIFTYSYDTSGLLLEEYSYWPYDPDASWTRKRYQYEGDLILYEIVENSNGEIKKYKYSYRSAYYLDETNLVVE